MDKENVVGITEKKEENFSEWYNQVVLKAELADFSAVKGFMVMRPNSYQVWEKIQATFDAMIKKTGHKNAYFPALIPESFLTKEKEHVEGFSPEVFWVTRTGETDLNEKLAMRPTSETIMYDSYSKWIRSWRDLPLLLNSWCSVFRCDTKMTKLFLRTREFLWQEGHTCHATKEEAEKEVMDILDLYVKLVQDYLAIPVIIGKKTKLETFPGADYTTTMEALMPDGKALQSGTSHLLGQNFAKAFDIKFVDKDEKEKFVWQTSWGISTRLIGALVMVHGDNKGLVLPPKLAVQKAVIVPILFKGKEKPVLEKANDLKKSLEALNAVLDDRANYTPGWKYSEWEMKGIPLRIEIGPRDVENKKVVIVRRDTGEKTIVDFDSALETANKLLGQIQTDMFAKAKDFLNNNFFEIDSLDEFKKRVEQKKMVSVPFCEEPECEEKIKEDTGASSRCIPFNQKEKKMKCIGCGKSVLRRTIFAKEY